MCVCVCVHAHVFDRVDEVTESQLQNNLTQPQTGQAVLRTIMLYSGTHLHEELYVVEDVKE